MHGFNSGPTSIKGRQLGDAIAALPEAARPEYYLPQLSHRPAEVVRTVCRWVDAGDHDHLTFIGSSLGGNGVRDARSVRVFSEGVPSNEKPEEANVRRGVGGRG